MNCHLVPKFYIKRFADPDRALNNSRLWHYSFDDGRWKQAGPRRVASVPDYYVLTDADGLRDESIEREFLKQIEDSAGAILRSKVDAGVPLDAQERIALSRFIALMSLRVPSFHRIVGDFASEVTTTAMVMASSLTAPEEHEAFLELLKTHQFEVGREAPMQISLSLVDELAPYIHGMGWTFMVSERPHYFVTSDSPFCKVNPDTIPPMSGGDGLAAQNIEVSLPLSRTVAFFAGWLSHGTRWIVVPPETVKEINRRSCLSATMILAPKPKLEGFDQILRDWEFRRSHRRFRKT